MAGTLPDGGPPGPLHPAKHPELPGGAQRSKRPMAAPQGWGATGANSGTCVHHGGTNEPTENLEGFLPELVLEPDSQADWSRAGPGRGKRAREDRSGSRARFLSCGLEVKEGIGCGNGIWGPARSPGVGIKFILSWRRLRFNRCRKRSSQSFPYQTKSRNFWEIRTASLFRATSIPRGETKTNLS